MRLHSLRIERLPGIEVGFGLESLDPKVNVVLGPNASGKTSLTRALEAVLYREVAKGVAAHVAATFEDGEGTLEAIRLGPDIHWTRGGQSVAAPRVPDYHLRGCYVLHVKDLFAAGETERAVQGHLARELAGGYELEPVAQRFRLKTTHGRSELKDYRKAENELHAIQQAQRALRGEETRLEDLREEQEVARLALAEVERCRYALAFLQARRKRRACEQDLAHFPEGMDRLHGDEWQRLQTFGERRRELKGERQAAERSRQEAERQLKDSGLANATLGDTALAEQRRRLQALHDCERDVMAFAEKEREGALRLRDAAEALGAAVPERAVSPDAMRRAEEELGEKRKREARVHQLETELERLPETDVAPEADTLRSGRGELSRWLAAPPAVWRPVRIAGSVLLGLSAVAGIVVAALSADTRLALLLVPAVIGLYLLARSGGPGSRERREARTRYRRTDLPEPAAWTDSGVRKQLAALEREIAEADARRVRCLRRREVEGELEAARHALEKAVEGLRELAQTVGFEPIRLDAEFYRWLQLVHDHDEARRSLGIVQESLEAHRERASALRAGLVAFLEAYGELPGVAKPDPGILEARLSALERRLKGRDGAKRDRLAAKRRAEELETELARVEGDVDKLFADTGLNSGDDAALRERLELRGAWQKAREALRDAQSVERERANLLGEHSELLLLVEEEDEEALERRTARFEEQAGRYEALTREIADISARVGAARRGRVLEEARAKRQVAEDALRERLEEALLAEAGVFLMEKLRIEHEAVSQPPVLAKARKWFQRFTRHHFDLVFDGNDFGAVDTRSGAHRRLDELSTGTCTQLLLAVRLAFAEEAERGRQALPLFLDEALTTSDPERFRAAVESLWMLADRGERQIFYLTAQPADVAFWGREEGGGPHVIDLARVRQLETAVADPAALYAPRPPEVPAPKEENPEEYAVLIGVPPLDPWADVAAIHLFYLLRDKLPLLHRLLENGVERAGTMRLLLRSGAAHVLLSTEECEELACRLDAVEIWVELWRQGRGRPVDRTALEDSGAVSSTFMDRVATLAQELRGDAEALLKALEDGRVARFHAKNIDKLREWFAENQYLDDRQPLGRRELVLHILGAVGVSEAGSHTAEGLRAMVESLNGSMKNIHH